MPKANEIRHRISAVEETRKITNAMQLVATARAKKVMPQMEYNQTFLRQVQGVMKELLLSTQKKIDAYCDEKLSELKLESETRGDFIKIRDDEYLVTLKITENNSKVFEINLTVCLFAHSKKHLTFQKTVLSAATAPLFRIFPML